MISSNRERDSQRESERPEQHGATQNWIQWGFWLQRSLNRTQSAADTERTGVHWYYNAWHTMHMYVMMCACMCVGCMQSAADSQEQECFCAPLACKLCICCWLNCDCERRLCAHVCKHVQHALYTLYLHDAICREKRVVHIFHVHCYHSMQSAAEMRGVYKYTFLHCMWSAAERRYYDTGALFCTVHNVHYSVLCTVWNHHMACYVCLPSSYFWCT